MKDKRLMKLFEDICKKNDEEIKNKQEFMPMCILIKKDYAIDIIGFSFDNQDEKIKMRETLKQFVAVQDIKGYILIQDAKVTKVHQETGERTVSDVSMRQLFTPKFAISRMQEYCDGVLGEVMVMDNRKDMDNAWDLWNSQEPDENNNEQIKEYQKYKNEHPELYKGVYELDDYNKVKSKDKIIFAYKIDDMKFKYYKAKDIEQEDKKKIEEVIKMTKAMSNFVGNGEMKMEFIKIDKNGVEILS